MYKIYKMYKIIYTASSPLTLNWQSGQCQSPSGASFSGIGRQYKCHPESQLSQSCIALETDKKDGGDEEERKTDA